MSTYSFINVQAAIAGPGGSFSLGYGAGHAEEGITVEMLEDKDDMKVGADGSVMHSLRANNAGRVMIRLLKTSPVNAMLQDLYNFQKQSSGNWGQNNIVVSDTVRGDIETCTLMAFTKQPSIVYAKDGNTNEWVFHGVVNQNLGTGVPDANVQA